MKMVIYPGFMAPIRSFTMLILLSESPLVPVMDGSGHEGHEFIVAFQCVILRNEIACRALSICAGTRACARHLTLQ